MMMTEQKPNDGPNRAPLIDRPEGYVRRFKIFSGRDLRASSVGWEVAIPLFAGPLIGFLIDRRLGTGVRWTLILVLVGLILGVIALVRYVRYEMHLMKKEMETKEREAEEKKQAEIYDAFNRRR
jgi:uncharacterized membrane-anchored protein YhcB (DUF1043 family)